jgi:prolyl oligopeptidase
MTQPDASDDPYRWLEDVDGSDALAWVRERNAEAVAALTGSARFGELREELRQVLDSDARIPWTTWRGDHLYNLWQDAAHPRGVWRRTTLDEYRKQDPDWQVLLDLDALAAEEGENWVWQGVAVLRPEYRRGLVSLSRGGSDACVVREFDLATRAFVADGFTLPEAKSSVHWIDLDRIYVGTDFGPGSLTSSGYPRIVKEWRRGTPLAAATIVHECDADDMRVDAWHDPTPGFTRDVVLHSMDFFRTRKYLRRADGTLDLIDVPDDAQTDTHREWLLIRLRSDWTAGAATYPAGALLVARLGDFLAGDRDLAVLFEPTPGVALSDHHWTRNHLILSLLADVRSRLEILTPAPGGWQRVVLSDPDGFRQVDAVDTNRHHTDEYLLRGSGFLRPPAVRHGRVGGDVEVVKEAPAFFDTAGMAVRQFFATSGDGTRVPYFVVGDPDAGPGPALLGGYGGFGLSRTPSYDALVGRGWLARGGTYVLANIRGGGEYGPQWHQAAMRERRPRAFEDFAAVARDLVERRVTTREQLGTEGGSNGGLLTGVMLTRYPDLFGAIVSQVPLLDMRRYHELLAGASWMAEYGDPDDPADWAYLKEFSPYQNVRAGQPYPPVLLYTSTRDDRVHPGHARKMAARLREYGYDVTFYENIEGGHGGAADNAQLSFKRALILEFLWRRLRP